ncbi:MAG TPA: hypothetical protein VK612_01345 [Pyrinomonadaceae bacterium]|nr:hypothetical protein [Pyrinomonadaceae bacterium]
MLTAIETTGTINADHRIELDQRLPENAPERVRVIVLFDEDTDINEVEWRKAIGANDVFEFLSDDSEDIYTLADGMPINEK